MFKDGNQIRCINNIDNKFLELGKIYTFKSYDIYIDYNIFLYLEEIPNHYFFSFRFELVKEKNVNDQFNNKYVVDEILIRTKYINENVSLKNSINAGFSEGSGYYIEFPYNSYTKMMIKRKYYLNTKTYAQIGYLLNRYKELFLNEMFVFGKEN
jgi:hypothetical protein